LVAVESRPALTTAATAVVESNTSTTVEPDTSTTVEPTTTPSTTAEAAPPTDYRLCAREPWTRKPFGPPSPAVLFNRALAGQWLEADFAPAGMFPILHPIFYSILSIFSNSFLFYSSDDGTGAGPGTGADPGRHDVDGGDGGGAAVA